MPPVYGILFLVANVALLVSSSQITSNHVQRRSAIETPISRCDIRPEAISQLYETSKVCRHTQCPPEVTVSEYGSLVVNWEKSFEDCDPEEVRGALVRIDSKDVTVSFVEGKVKVKTNTCLAQKSIKVVLNLATRSQVWSRVAQYNEYNVNPKLEELYSGLLRKPIHEKICDRNINVFRLSDVPDEIKECMKGSPNINRIGEHVFFSFTIVDPNSESKVKVVKDTYKISEHCKKENGQSNSGDEETSGIGEPGDSSGEGKIPSNPSTNNTLGRRQKNGKI